MDRGDDPLEQETPEIDRLRQRVAELEASEVRLRRTERDLAESRERFRAFAAASSEGIAITERGRILDVCPRFCAITGYDREDLLGKSPEIMLAPADRQFVMEKILTEYGEPYECTIIRKDGQTLPVEVHGRAMRYKGRRCRVTALREISARRRAEQALRESEQRFRSMVANIPETVFQCEPEPPWRVRFVTPGIETLTGYPVRDFMDGGRDFDSLILPEERPRVRRIVREAVAERRAYRVEYRLRRADGELRWVTERGRGAYDEHGTPQWLDGVMLDTTDRHEAEDALRREKDFAARLIDVSTDGILAFDRQCRYTLWSAGMERIYGIPAKDVVGRVAFEVFPFLKAIGEEQYFQDALAGKAVEATDRRYMIPESGREGFFEGHYGPLYDEEGRVIGGLGVIRDVTDRVRAEQERRKLDTQIQQAQKLESLGVLAGGIAHDFNNLLVAILGNADLALDDLPAQSPARPSVEEIKTASLRAADLANQMLAYSGRGRFVLTNLRLNELIKEMARLLKVSMSKKITLNYALAPELPAVEADAAQIRQVVMNLITNAAEAIGDEPGIVTVSTGVMDAESDYLDRSQLGQSQPAGRYVYLEVTDTGCGIGVDSVAKLFEPFYTTKFTGRGLGLAAVLGIVRGHAGAIRVDSRLGEGTTVRVLLPPAEGVPAPTAAPPAPADIGAGGGGTVLVVDDEQSVRELAGRMLQRAGFTVLTAADGRQAVDTFAARADDIDAVLLDLTMPEMSGEEALDELHRIRSDVPVLLASGYAAEDVTRRFADKPLAGFIHKPFQLAELVGKLRQVLRKK